MCVYTHPESIVNRMLKVYRFIVHSQVYNVHAYDYTVVMSTESGAVYDGMGCTHQ